MMQTVSMEAFHVRELRRPLAAVGGTQGSDVLRSEERRSRRCILSLRGGPVLKPSGAAGFCLFAKSWSPPRPSSAAAPPCSAAPPPGAST
eukprot:CAMPEP_0180189970 /NCGR_PEP_ID=MMETSP0987-20121128/632_1 /TAXON_ID=697907 /ORGANISM="non described non described, Strain CCMP2293" /LENGTH=89 /DNA_ID=CAMNT_0022144369 /DNA_START=396 /DNA_END=662 /DNA_ORIENTATION=+